MNLHLSVDHPGNFNFGCSVSDGTWYDGISGINSEMVFDANQDCSDDEIDCKTAIMFIRM